MEITRIKYDFDKVIIAYKNESNSGKDVNILQSNDAPNLEFVNTLKAFTKDALNIADLPEMYSNGLIVEDVKFSVVDEIEHVQIIAKKVIKSGEMKLSLPIISLQAKKQDVNQMRLMDNCNALKDEAMDYIRGKRQQESMFLGIDRLEKNNPAKELINTIAKNGGGSISVEYGIDKETIEIEKAS